MTIHATFVGRVIEPAKQFGNLVVLRAVSNEKQGGDFDSIFVDIKLKADSNDGQNALKYERGDDVTAIGQLRKQPWKPKRGETKSDRYSYVLMFPRLETPYAIRTRGGDVQAATAGNTMGGGKTPGQNAAPVEETDELDPLAGIA